MIIRQNVIEINDLSSEYALEFEGNKEIFKEAVFFDLEHYVYKKPICIGVFGCCYFDNGKNQIVVTQYMIENKKDSIDILTLAKEYFKDIQKIGKKYIVTFSGNNDFIVINYLLNKYKINYKIDDNFKSIDLQKAYEKEKGKSVGLKALEKEFEISRDSELISGSNLAKTFSKIMKDDEYIKRMPIEKRNKILLYNEQDVVSLFHIYVNWGNFIKKQEE